MALLNTLESVGVGGAAGLLGGCCVAHSAVELRRESLLFVADSTSLRVVSATLSASQTGAKTCMGPAYGRTAYTSGEVHKWDSHQYTSNMQLAKA